MGATDKAPASISATPAKLTTAAAAGGPATQAPSAADAVLPTRIEPGEEDEFDVTEGWETGSAGSTSAESSIYAHTFATRVSKTAGIQYPTTTMNRTGRI